jgi:hypothetical protein
LQRLLQFLHFGVRIFLEAIDLDGEAIDFFLRLRARGVVQHRAALLQLLLVSLQGFGFLLELGRLFLCQRLHFAARRLAFARLGRDALQIEKRHSQRRLLRGHCRRWRGCLGKRRPAESHHAEHRGD